MSMGRNTTTSSDACTTCSCEIPLHINVFAHIGMASGPIIVIGIISILVWRCYFCKDKKLKDVKDIEKTAGLKSGSTDELYPENEIRDRYVPYPTHVTKENAVKGDIGNEIEATKTETAVQTDSDVIISLRGSTASDEHFYTYPRESMVRSSHNYDYADTEENRKQSVEMTEDVNYVNTKDTNAKPRNQEKMTEDVNYVNTKDTNAKPRNQEKITENIGYANTIHDSVKDGRECSYIYAKPEKNKKVDEKRVGEQNDGVPAVDRKDQNKEKSKGSSCNMTTNENTENVGYANTIHDSVKDGRGYIDIYAKPEKNKKVEEKKVGEQNDGVPAVNRKDQNKEKSKGSSCNMTTNEAPQKTTTKRGKKRKDEKSDIRQIYDAKKQNNETIREKSDTALNEASQKTMKERTKKRTDDKKRERQIHDGNKHNKETVGEKSHAAVNENEVNTISEDGQTEEDQEYIAGEKKHHYENQEIVSDSKKPRESNIYEEMENLEDLKRGNLHENNTVTEHETMDSKSTSADGESKIKYVYNCDKTNIYETSNRDSGSSDETTPKSNNRESGSSSEVSVRDSGSSGSSTDSSVYFVYTGQQNCCDGHVQKLKIINNFTNIINTNEVNINAGTAQFGKSNKNKFTVN